VFVTSEFSLEVLICLLTLCFYLLTSLPDAAK